MGSYTLYQPNSWTPPPQSLDLPNTTPSTHGGLGAGDVVKHGGRVMGVLGLQRQLLSYQTNTCSRSHAINTSALCVGVGVFGSVRVCVWVGV